MDAKNTASASARPSARRAPAAASGAETKATVPPAPPTVTEDDDSDWMVDEDDYGEDEYGDDKYESPTGAPATVSLAKVRTGVEDDDDVEFEDDVDEEAEDDGDGEAEDEDRRGFGPVFRPPRRRAEPVVGFHSRGQAEIASFIPPGYGGQYAARPKPGGAPAPPAPPPPAPPDTRSNGPSPALVAVAVAVVVATLALLVISLLGEKDGDAGSAPASAGTTSSGPDRAALWDLDGNRIDYGHVALRTAVMTQVAPS